MQLMLFSVVRQPPNCVFITHVGGKALELLQVPCTMALLVTEFHTNFNA